MLRCRIHTCFLNPTINSFIENLVQPLRLQKMLAFHVQSKKYYWERINKILRSAINFYCRIILTLRKSWLYIFFFFFTACFGILKSPSGIMSFPETPNTTYPLEMNCGWIITTNASHVLNISFEYFAVEASHECDKDFLQVIIHIFFTYIFLFK